MYQPTFKLGLFSKGVNQNSRRCPYTGETGNAACKSRMCAVCVFSAVSISGCVPLERSADGGGVFMPYHYNSNCADAVDDDNPPSSCH
jgi:hypothetical protein